MKMTKRQVLLYGIFGVFTTAINIVAFIVLEKLMPYLIANVIAWIVSVLFAFFTNKYYVFQSKSFDTDVWLRELWEFILARTSTGLIDFIGMFILISCLQINALISKTVLNLIIIIGNYVLSKYWIFRQKGN